MSESLLKELHRRNIPVINIIIIHILCKSFVIYGCLKSGAHRKPSGSLHLCCDTHCFMQTPCCWISQLQFHLQQVDCSLITLRSGDSAKLFHLKSSLVDLSICLGSLPSWPMKCAPTRFYAFKLMCTNTTLLSNSAFIQLLAFVGVGYPLAAMHAQPQPSLSGSGFVLYHGVCACAASSKVRAWSLLLIFNKETCLSKSCTAVLNYSAAMEGIFFTMQRFTPHPYTCTTLLQYYLTFSSLAVITSFVRLLANLLTSQRHSFAF